MAKGQKKTDLRNLPACAAEFIRQVVKKMRYRRKVRRDVQVELSAHFEDELKDYKTEQEKEQKAQQLIAKFGDVKLLAVLLRRAKKRCRPLWRTVCARTVQTVGVLLVCLVAYVVWFFSGRPVISTNYLSQLNQIVRPAVEQELNSAPLYDEAAKLIENIDKEVQSILSKKSNQITSEERELLARWMADNNNLLELLVAGTHRPYYWRKYETGQCSTEMITILMPGLSSYRKLAYALRWRAWLSVEKGMYEEAFDDLVACYRFGRHLRTGAFIVEQLVGMSIEGLSVQGIRQILDENEISPTTLAEMQRTFEDAIANERFTMNLEAEKLSSYDVIQRTFTDGIGGGHIIPKQLMLLYPEVTLLSDGTGQYNTKDQSQGWLLCMLSDLKDAFGEVSSLAKKWSYLLFFHPDKGETFRAVRQFYEHWEAIAEKSPAQLRAEDKDIEKETTNIIDRNLLLREFMPAFARVNMINYRHKADVEATPTIIAILRYKQDKGDFPESLNALVDVGYLKELPIDPYSDKPFIYKKSTDNFRLYSVGEDFKDDGGEFVRDEKGRINRWPRQGDWIFWPLPEPDIN